MCSTLLSIYSGISCHVSEARSPSLRIILCRRTSGIRSKQDAMGIMGGKDMDGELGLGSCL